MTSYSKKPLVYSHADDCRIDDHLELSQEFERKFGLFHFTKQLYYVNNAYAMAMPDDSLAVLKNLYADENIAEWDKDYCVEEPESTGSYRWTFVFRDDTSNVASYGGSTSNMDNFPENYEKVNEKVKSLIEE